MISSSDEPHFLLIVAHYIYHLQTPGLPLSSVTFLSSVASLFPMSLLACLGKSARNAKAILGQVISLQASRLCAQFDHFRLPSSVTSSRAQLDFSLKQTKHILNYDNFYTFKNIFLLALKMYFSITLV